MLRRATRTIKRARRYWKMLGAFGWFAAGMALWIGAALAWQSWQNVQASRHTAKLAPTKPVAQTPPPAPPPVDWPARYIAEADAILAAYAAAPSAALRPFDWHKAEIRLQDAIDQGRGGDDTLGALAMVKGYSDLERLGEGPATDEEASRLRIDARDRFEEAARRLPQSAGPHLALARVFVYSLPDLARARAEFAAAEKLGAEFHPREIEQQADAWRIRAQQLARSNPREAWAAAQQARALYLRVQGFDRADEHRKELARIRPPMAQPAAAHRSKRWR